MKAIIKVYLAAVMVLFSLSLFAQQDPIFTHYMFNLSNINPGAAGHNDLASVMNVNRYQWVGMDGAPRTHSLIADVPIPKFNCGAGLTYLFDKIGPESTNNIYVDYAYHLKVTENLRLGLGLKAGFRVYSANLNDLSSENDPQFASNINGKITPNFGVGGFLYSNTYYVGLSSPKVLNHRYVNSTASGGEKRHYFLVAGYVVFINKNLLFKPSMMAKYVESAPFSFDINANFLLRNTIWFGMMFRSGDAIGFLTQVQINNKWHLGYTYDYTFSKLRTASKGTHEILLKFEFSTNVKEGRSHWLF
ncbi:MAG: type IX secretion system membrane protein PorP/SprF [Bacteroidales bacterium]|nr:MAG: type IX secretion system membrane protein PorP/SprF [Bacteroidales bacterium]